MKRDRKKASVPAGVGAYFSDNIALIRKPLITKKFITSKPAFIPSIANGEIGTMPTGCVNLCKRLAATISTRNILS